MPPPAPNPFLLGPLGPIFARTALPIILVMGMNGLLAVVDAMFLGRYVGPHALSAVTLVFPLYMVIVALATLVSSGMSSILARHLGAGNRIEAARVFVGAHGLALVMSAILILCYLLFGRAVTLALASGSEAQAYMGRDYLGIIILMSSLVFVLSVNSDALRNEGRVGFMATMSLLVSCSNIGFNYLLIALLEWGVAGSAMGTALAQLLALCIIAAFRIWGRTDLRLRLLVQSPLSAYWPRILALGAPQSLNFVGISLSSAAVIVALQLVNTPIYETTVAAFGIMTRVMTFAFLPLLGLTHGLQTIVGNNYGAGALARSDQGLRIGMGVALIYCLTVQAAFITQPEAIASLFVTDQAVIAEFARILPVNTAMLWLSGPLIVIAAYFQAIGNATRAAVLSLTKGYAFSLPLIFGMPMIRGEPGIWLAGPLAEGMMAVLTFAVLHQTVSALGLRWGLFAAQAQPRRV